MYLWFLKYVKQQKAALWGLTVLIEQGILPVFFPGSIYHMSMILP